MKSVRIVLLSLVLLGKMPISSFSFIHFSAPYQPVETLREDSTYVIRCNPYQVSDGEHVSVRRVWYIRFMVVKYDIQFLSLSCSLPGACKYTLWSWHTDECVDVCSCSFALHIYSIFRYPHPARLALPSFSSEWQIEFSSSLSRNPTHKSRNAGNSGWHHSTCVYV